MDRIETRDVRAKTDRAVARDRLQQRHDDLLHWLQVSAPECFSDQNHLDENSEARAYWHYGYYMALKDVLAMIGTASTPRH
jgi:hypothetical protein